MANQVTGGDPPPDRHAMLHAIFVMMDADKSDYVDAQEFKSIFSDVRRRQIEALGNHSLTAGDRLARQVGEKYADERMAEIDNVRGRGDSDGRLSAVEFW